MINISKISIGPLRTFARISSPIPDIYFDYLAFSLDFGILLFSTMKSVRSQLQVSSFARTTCLGPGLQPGVSLSSTRAER
jgi:hypothetical protein